MQTKQEKYESAVRRNIDALLGKGRDKGILLAYQGQIDVTAATLRARCGITKADTGDYGVDWKGLAYYHNATTISLGRKKKAEEAEAKAKAKAQAEAQEEIPHGPKVQAGFYLNRNRGRLSAARTRNSR
jgi:hypothetical protein